MVEATRQSYPFPVSDPGDGSARDVLTEVLRDGAQRMLANAIEDELSVYLNQRTELVDDVGHRQVVRNGYLPKRTILTGLGPVPVRQPRVRDRRPAEQREQFRSTLLPAYLRKTRSLEELLPWLYLKGISSGDFGEALQALLGANAKGLSATTITRLKSIWETEYKDFCKQSLAHKHYVYVWADGVYFNVRLEEEGNDRQCILVLMGATAEGKKELIAISDGYRESTQSWRELLLDCKSRGL
ncbi:MAG: transposase, partial [Candidatus Tectomicrobia bacterium]